MRSLLEQKCVVVTGAATGLGRDSSESVTPVTLDVTDPESVARAVEHALSVSAKGSVPAGLCPG